MKLDTRILMSRCDGHRFVARLRKYDGRDQQLRHCGRYPALRRSCPPATQPRAPGTPRVPPRDPYPRHHLELNANHAGHSSRSSTRSCRPHKVPAGRRYALRPATPPRHGPNARVSQAQTPPSHMHVRMVDSATAQNVHTARSERVS